MSRILLAVLSLFCFHAKIMAEEEEIKVLVLIIASDHFPGIDRQYPYKELQEIWRAYMHSDPAHFESYFIKADPYLSDDYRLIEDVLWTKTEECAIPGILNKTVLSIETLLPRLQEFDFLLRPNLSSFYVFPRLLEFLKQLPRTGCYCGFPGSLGNGAKFASGCGFILSTDLAEMLVAHKGMLVGNNYDDTTLGLFFRDKGIRVIPAPRKDFHSLRDWNKGKDKISSSDFHFRVKNATHELRATEDIYILSELFKMFY